ncbi:hypothetical protein Cni_G05666 [Canna indica]|uniref:Uncharacterized protein n=1 Tax=Canna indica TaxID=4628 RepID=A0AAQ3JX17_9LILI|nr:hypothetical protein Cni_G05666 [Canna indica]
MGQIAGEELVLVYNTSEHADNFVWILAESARSSEVQLCESALAVAVTLSHQVPFSPRVAGSDINQKDKVGWVDLKSFAKVNQTSTTFLPISLLDTPSLPLMGSTSDDAVAADAFPIGGTTNNGRRYGGSCVASVINLVVSNNYRGRRVKQIAFVALGFKARITRITSPLDGENAGPSCGSYSVANGMTGPFSLRVEVRRKLTLKGAKLEEFRDLVFPLAQARNDRKNQIVSFQLSTLRSLAVLLRNDHSSSFPEVNIS